MRKFRESYHFREPKLVGKYIGGKQFKITIDDVIDCFKDLTDNKGTYTTIFDNHFFGFLKSIHDQYGTVFNLSTNFNDFNSHGCGIGWDLSKMTDKFKQDFKNNAHWLKFSFHAFNHNTRYRTYKHHPATTHEPKCGSWVETDWDYSRNAFADYLRMKHEFERFAGLECWYSFDGIFHAYDGRRYEMGLLRKYEGWRVFQATPYYTDRMRQFLYLNGPERGELYENGIWYDPEIDIFVTHRQFSIEKVVGPIAKPFNSVTEMLNQHNFPLMEFMEVETHETYVNRNIQSVMNGYVELSEWCLQNGYEPRFPNENDFIAVDNHSWR